MKTLPMLLDFKREVTTRGYNIRGVLHLGAHLAEEACDYYDVGIRDVVWVEGNPDLRETLVARLERFTENRLIIALISDHDGEAVRFNVSNYQSMSSSLFEFGTHPTFSPDTVWVERKMLPTRSVDSLAAEHDFDNVNMLVMDLQGAELLALRGAERFLNHVDYVYSEISKDEIYIGGVLISDLTQFLQAHGFRMVTLAWGGHGWGDGLWQRQ